MKSSRTIKRNIILMCIILAFVVIFSTEARAATYGFQCITNNSLTDAAIGEAQLFVDVTDPGGDQVLFTFINDGPEASSITDVYFDDGALLGLAAIDNSDPGVSFLKVYKSEVCTELS